MAVSRRLRFEILRRDGHLCRYCGFGPPDVKLTVDHVVPVALQAARTDTQALFDHLPTLESAVSEYGRYAPELAAKHSPTQSELDAYLTESRAEIERSRAARAKHAAECPGCGWCTVSEGGF